MRQYHMYQLDIEQSFNTNKQSLFNAFTDPKVMQTWFAPGDMKVPEASSEAKVGGAYRVVMENSEGEQFIVGGEFLTLNEFDLIEFTWQWQDSPHTTRVKVRLSDNGEGGTLLKLNHSEFTELEFRDKHNEGWMGCLHNLAKAV